MSENSSVGQKHPYHLVDPSPLPLMGSIAGLAMAAGLVFFMHYETKWLLILGTIFLAVCLFRSIKGHSNPEHHFGFEAAAWYWHFVDVVWLFLFAAIYIWGS